MEITERWLVNNSAPSDWLYLSVLGAPFCPRKRDVNAVMRVIVRNSLMIKVS